MCLHMDRSEAEVDREIIAAVVRGDVDLYSKLVDNYQGYVFSIALKAFEDRALAEELTHDIFVKAYFALSGFRGDASFKTWLTRITLNTIRTKLKSLQSTKLSSFVFDSKRFAAVSDSETLEIEMREHGLYASIQSLKPKFRAVVELC